MPDVGNTAVFSQTDASNNSATMPGWNGAALPSTIDDAGRAFQGAFTREWNWRNPTITSGGAANVQTLTYSVAPAALYNGQTHTWIAGFTNTGSATLNINALGATTIKKIVAGSLVALVGGEIVAGDVITTAYNSANTCEILLSAKPNRKGADVASAATTAFLPNEYFHVTGTTTITDIDFSTAEDGRAVIVQFDGILTLTHNATTLVLPGGVNITTAAGDTACFIQDSGDNIKCLWYCKAQAAVYGGWVPDVILEDQKASGTDGGTFTSGADRTRTLNTEVRDIHGLCSLAANQFTLVAGTYYIEWKAPSLQVTSNQTLLYNATDAAEVKRGTTDYSYSGGNQMSWSMGQAVVTIASAKAFEIRHRGTSTKATDGFGLAASFGTEIYTVVKISKIAV